jgi:opacity protein-like surface antigen
MKSGSSIAAALQKVALLHRMRAFTLTLLSFIVASAAFAAQPYLRLGAGFERSDDTTQRDRDCAATAPPALFGCGTGLDDRPFGARGDFGRTKAWELAGGFELTKRSRIELGATHRGDLELDAQSNFLGVTAEQPVKASARATTALLTGSVDIGRLFVTAGAGLSRNELGAVTYSFPGIAPDAATITRGGDHTTFAWTAGAGTSIPLTERLLLDLTLRYSSLGTFQTRTGPATIVRPSRTFELEIAGTEASVKTLGVSASLRWRM